MKKLKATCDRILARLPIIDSSATVVGGIIIPEKTLKDMQRNTILTLDIESAGPDCKVARAGLKVIVNKNVCAPLEIDGVEWMVFSEVTAIAIVEEVAEPAKAPSAQPPLSIEEVKAALGIGTKPVDDSSALPAETEKPAGAQMV